MGGRGSKSGPSHRGSSRGESRVQLKFATKQKEAKQRVTNMVATMDEAGFGSCTNTGACSAECPKEIGQINIARLNQEYISSTLAGFLKKKNDRN